MMAEEMVKKSPLRILETATGGDPSRGRIAVIASRKGVGKTAFLVQVAIDKLLQKKAVIHISYASRVDHIMTWYEHIFGEMGKSFGLESSSRGLDELVRNRVIMNFSQQGTRTSQVLRSVEALIRDGRFPAETVIVDGFDFSRSSPGDLENFKSLGERLGPGIWFSASLKKEDPLFDERGYPYELLHCLDQIDILHTLHHDRDRIHLGFVKGRDVPSPAELGLALDPKTLLLIRDPSGGPTSRTSPLRSPDCREATKRGPGPHTAD